MHISFICDPFVPQGIRKVFKQTIEDLRKIFPVIDYSVETKESLTHHQTAGEVHSSKIFQKKHINGNKHYFVYVVSGKLFSRKCEVYGVSVRNVCVVGLKDIPRTSYEIWSSLVWELILHELGHSFGLVPRNRRSIDVNRFNVIHCTNNCVMSDEVAYKKWFKKALLRKQTRIAYCEICTAFLKKNSIQPLPS